MALFSQEPVAVLSLNNSECLNCPAGNIRNTERLSFERQQSYVVMVTAFDCGQRSSEESVAVYIDVKPVCRSGWQGQGRRAERHRGTLLSGC